MRIYSVAAILFLTLSCQNGNKLSDNQPVITPETELVFGISKPLNGSKFKINEEIRIEIDKKPEVKVDSFAIYVNKKQVASLSSDFKSFSWKNENRKIGRNFIEIEAFSATEERLKKSVVVYFYPELAPHKYSYKIIKTYPHSRNSYTQGLIYENGYFYESCGEYHKSALRKVKLETGEFLLNNSLEGRYFAEGLALYNEKLYQLTWQERTAFVYDKTTFKLEKKIEYDFNEGWGLEFDGKNFLMTNGTNVIYKLDPESFTEVSRIEILDNNGPVDSVNELELIDNKIFANVYMTNRVVIIDPETGIIEGEIDFSGLLPKSDYDETTNVLNGIAYNKVSKHLYITGKNWPKLFEIELNKK